jgi:hypothetical protein
MEEQYQVNYRYPQSTRRPRLKEVGSGSKFCRWLKEQGWPQIGHRLLCFNCNAAHGLLGYCPHQSEIKRG